MRVGAGRSRSGCSGWWRRWYCCCWCRVAFAEATRRGSRQRSHRSRSRCRRRCRRRSPSQGPRSRPPQWWSQLQRPRSQSSRSQRPRRYRRRRPHLNLCLSRRRNQRRFPRRRPSQLPRRRRPRHRCRLAPAAAHHSPRATHPLRIRSLRAAAERKARPSCGHGSTQLDRSRTPKSPAPRALRPSTRLPWPPCAPGDSCPRSTRAILWPAMWNCPWCSGCVRRAPLGGELHGAVSSTGARIRPRRHHAFW